MSLYPPSNLLVGPAGTGKTSAIATLLDRGIKVNLLCFEPSSPARVLERVKEINLARSKTPAQPEISTENFHWRYVSPAVPSWGALMTSAKIINTMTLSDIAEMRTGIAKPDGTQWMAMLNAMANFTSDRTGEVLGDATDWGPDTAFVIDGLTGMSTMSRNLTVGLKPNPHPGEWGVMQSNILTLINKLCGDCKSFFVLIGHVEKGEDYLTGLTQINVSTLGAKLAPKLPPLFTNVVYAKKTGTEFFWSTAERNVDTKNGDLPLADDLHPDFAPIINSFRAKLEEEQEARTADLKVLPALN